MDITAKKLCGGVALLIFLVVAKEGKFSWLIRVT